MSIEFDHQKQAALLICFQVVATSRLIVRTQIEKMHLLANTVLDASQDFKQLCQMHLGFLQQHTTKTGLQPVIECEEEYLNRKSSFLSFKDYYQQFHCQDKSALKKIVQPVTEVQEVKFRPTHQNSQIESEKSIETLSQQLSHIKINKKEDITNSEKIQHELESVDPSNELSSLKETDFFNYFQDLKQDLSKEFQLSQSQVAECEANQSKWYEDADISYHPTSHNSNDSSNIDEHDYYWKNEDDSQEDILPDFLLESSLFDIQFPVNFDENSLASEINQINDNINHNTPKKKRLYCNNKKIPIWAQDLNVVQSKQKKQNRNPSQLFGVLSKKALDEAFQLSQSKQRGSSEKWKKQKIYFDNYITNLDSKNKENYKKLKKHEQDSSKKINQFGQNLLFGHGRKNFLNLFSKN